MHRIAKGFPAIPAYKKNRINSMVLGASPNNFS